jgi:hypothetical protein
VVRFESRIAKFFAQKIRQPHIFLQRQQTRAALQNLAGEGAKSRPNFQDKIVPSDLGLLDNPARQVLIVQEILSQFFSPVARPRRRALRESVKDSSADQPERLGSAPAVHKKL